jgi:hypothetical protein
MKKKNFNDQILSKLLKNRKRPIIEAENMFGEQSLYITVEIIQSIDYLSHDLHKFHFDSKHKQYLIKVTDGYLTLVKNRLEKKLGVSLIAEPKKAVENLFQRHLMSSQEIISEFGENVEVVAQHQLEAIKAAIKYYHDYAITSENYVQIRGGKKLLEEVTEQTRMHFQGLVPGRWRWNLGNWRNGKGGGTGSVAPVQPTAPTPTLTDSTDVDDANRDHTQEGKLVEKEMNMPALPTQETNTKMDAIEPVAQSKMGAMLEKSRKTTEEAMRAMVESQLVIKKLSDNELTEGSPELTSTIPDDFFS